MVSPPLATLQNSDLHKAATRKTSKKELEAAIHQVGIEEVMAEAAALSNHSDNKRKGATGWNEVAKMACPKKTVHTTFTSAEETLSWERSSIIANLMLLQQCWRQRQLTFTV